MHSVKGSYNLNIVLLVHYMRGFVFFICYVGDIFSQAFDNLFFFCVILFLLIKMFRQKVYSLMQIFKFVIAIKYLLHVLLYIIDTK